MFVLMLLSLLIFSSNIISADQPYVATSATDQLNNLQGTVNNVSQSVDQIRSDYLSQQWTQLLSRMPYIGPVNSFFVANPLIFQILFNTTYSFSGAFLVTFIFWLIVVWFVYTASKAFVKGFILPLIIGIGLAIVLAQIGIINILVQFVLYVLNNNAAWWMRVIIWLIIFFIVIILYYVDHLIVRDIKKLRINKENAEREQKQKENSAYIEGLKEGQKEAGDESGGSGI